MKVEVTRDLIEEVVCCIVDCGLDRDEACDYAVKVMFDEANEIEEAEFE